MNGATTDIRNKTRRVRKHILDKFLDLADKKELTEKENKTYNDLLMVFAKNVIPRSTEITGEEGEPIKISDFKAICDFTRESPDQKYSLAGLRIGFPTIRYTRTLNEHHQRIIGLAPTLLYRLKELNEKRNKLHFFTDFKDAFEVESHIEKWKYIKETSIATIEAKLKERS